MSYLLKVWRGEERLVIVFWGYYVFVNLFTGVMLYLLRDHLKDTLFLQGIFVLQHIYAVLILVSLFRTAENYDGAKILSNLTRVWVALAAVAEMQMILSDLGLVDMIG